MMKAVETLPVIARHDLPRLLRHVADEIDSGAVSANAVAIVARHRRSYRDEDGNDAEICRVEVWSRGDGAEATDDIVGLLERGKRHIYSCLSEDGSDD